ncbi:hypothetical protein ABIA43_004586 [Bradyrhizobium sp. USDA 328]
MPGLVPGIHVLRAERQRVDGRDKPGHDGASILYVSSVYIQFETGIIVITFLS